MLNWKMFKSYILFLCQVVSGIQESKRKDLKRDLPPHSLPWVTEHLGQAGDSFRFNQVPSNFRGNRPQRVHGQAWLFTLVQIPEVWNTDPLRRCRVAVFCVRWSCSLRCFLFWLSSMWGVSSLTRDRTCAACLNHGTARYIPWCVILKHTTRASNLWLHKYQWPKGGEVTKSAFRADLKH